MFGLGLSTAFNGILGLAAPICFGQMKTAFGGNIEVLYTSGKTRSNITPTESLLTL